MNKILAGLQFFPENISRNLELSGGAVMAERVMIALTKRGMSRQQAHELMRTSNIQAVQAKKKLYDVLAARKEVTKLIPKDELVKMFNPKNYIGEAQEIVERAVGSH